MTAWEALEPRDFYTQGSLRFRHCAFLIHKKRADLTEYSLWNLGSCAGTLFSLHGNQAFREAQHLFTLGPQTKTLNTDFMCT